MCSEKFKIGDVISVIDDTIQGKISSIEADIISIEDENGFIRTYKSNEIVLQNANLYENIKIPKKKNKIKQTHLKVSKKVTPLEVDLHIHQITRSNRYLNSSAMLQRQLAVVKSKLQYAIKHHISKVIFIHGVGQGVLKAEIIKLLQNYPVEINDASYQKYGKGATEIYIYKSKL